MRNLSETQFWFVAAGVALTPMLTFWIADGIGWVPASHDLGAPGSSASVGTGACARSANRCSSAGVTPAFPQHSPPRLLPAAACGGLRSAPDHRTRRALLHLSYSCAPQPTHAALVTHGRVGMWRGGVRSTMSVAAPFVWRCLSGSAITPFPHPAHRTQQADFPHCALGQDLTPSSTARRAQADSGVRARSARRGARVDSSRPA